MRVYSMITAQFYSTPYLIRVTSNYGIDISQQRIYLYYTIFFSFLNITSLIRGLK